MSPVRNAILDVPGKCTQRRDCLNEPSWGGFVWEVDIDILFRTGLSNRGGRAPLRRLPVVAMTRRLSEVPLPNMVDVVLLRIVLDAFEVAGNDVSLGVGADMKRRWLGGRDTDGGADISNPL